jgi:hypothetical protein
MQHATIKKQPTKVYNTEQQAATITVKYNPWSRYYELSTIEQSGFQDQSCPLILFRLIVLQLSIALLSALSL